MRIGSCVLALASLLLSSTADTGYGKQGNLQLAKGRKRLTKVTQKLTQFVVKGQGSHVSRQKLIAGAGLALLMCTSHLSCGGGTALRGVALQQQYVRSPEEIVGRHVHFVSGGRDYVGYVADALASDEVSIDLYDGSIMTAKTDQVRGIRIDAHHDEHRQVMLTSHDKDKKFWHGLVVAVYDSNFYELMIVAYIDSEGNLHTIVSPYVIITHFDNILPALGEAVD